MIKVTTLCLDCVQVITNPFCPKCFSKHVFIWLKDKKIPQYNRQKIEMLFNKLITETEESDSEIECILCGNKRVNLCTYCFTNRAENTILKNVPIKIQEEFNEDFNTQIWGIL